MCYNGLIMLAQLLSSKPKSKLVKLFLTYPNRSFSYTELRVSTKVTKRLLQHTIKELVKFEFLLQTQKGKPKFFQINKHFPLYPELLGMIKDHKDLPKDLLARELAKVGDCKLVVLTGVFAGRPRTETDILLVGKVSPTKLKRALKLAEKFAEGEVSYTIFDQKEFEYRKVMNDRFVKDILDNNHVEVINKLKNKKK
jgi:hypothetical protein